MILEPNRRDLHPWIDRRPHRSAQRVPGHVIEPLREGLPAMFVQVHGGTIVEVGIELVNDASEFLNGVQTNAVGLLGDQEEDLQETCGHDSKRDAQPHGFVRFFRTTDLASIGVLVGIVFVVVVVVPAACMATGSG